MSKKETLTQLNSGYSHAKETGEPLFAEDIVREEFVDFDFLKNQNPESKSPPRAVDLADFGKEKEIPGKRLESIFDVSDKEFSQSAPDFEFLQDQMSLPDSDSDVSVAIEVPEDSPESFSPEKPSEDVAESIQQGMSEEDADLDLSFLDSSGASPEEDRPIPSKVSSDLPKQSGVDSSKEEHNLSESAADHEFRERKILINRANSIPAKNLSSHDFVSGSFSRKWTVGSIVDTGTYLGLDIGQGVTKYVLVKKKGREKVVRAFGILENPKNEEGDEKTRVQRILNHLGEQGLLKGSKINLALYGPDVGIHRMSLPPLKKKELAEATEWSLKKKFDFQDQDLISDFFVLGKKKIKGVEHDDILASIVPAKIVNAYIDPFLDRKVTPWHVRPLPLVLWTLYQKAHIQNADDCVAMVDIGAKKTIITFIRDNVVEFAREIPSGGDDITEGMTATIFHGGRAFQLSWEEAEQVKREFGFPINDDQKTAIRGVPLVEIGALMRPYLERLSSEIQRSVDYYRENFSVEAINRIYLLGGTADLKNLVEFLRMEIEEEIELFQFSTHFPLNLSSNEAKTFHNRFLELAVALGLALDTRRSLNLLPNPLRNVEVVKLQKRLFFYASFLTLILIVFLSGISFLKVSSLKNQFRQMQLEYKKIQPKKQRYDALLSRKKFLLSKKNIYQNELILDNPLPDILKLVSQMMPPEMALTGMSVTREDVTPEKAKKGKSTNRIGKKAPSKEHGKMPAVRVSLLRLNGVRYNPRPDEGIRIANFMLRLRDSGYFKSVTLLNQSLSEEENELRFEIICRF